MQVEILVDKPLVRGVPYKSVGLELVIISFKYERLQHLCYRCGLLGHVDRDCDRREEKDQPPQYGSYMRTSPTKMTSQRMSSVDRRGTTFGAESRSEGPRGCEKQIKTNEIDKCTKPKTIRKLDLIGEDESASNQEDNIISSDNCSSSMSSLEDITLDGSSCNLDQDSGEQAGRMAAIETGNNEPAIGHTTVMAMANSRVKSAGRKWKRKARELGEDQSIASYNTVTKK